MSNPNRVPGQRVIAFTDFTYITVFDQRSFAQSLTFKIKSNDQFTTLVFDVPTYDRKSETHAVIQFLGGNRLTMKTEAATITLERIARLPITSEMIQKVADDPKTALLLKSVQLIAEYEKTGEFPIFAGTAAMKMPRSRRDGENNLKQIGLAFHNYLDSYKTFPAAHSDSERWSRVSGEGERVIKRSWRVAILPYIGEQKLYDQLHLDEDWDSPHNLKLLDQMPAVFRDPNAKADTTETPYLAIVGPKTVIGNQPIGLRDVLDGTSNTIMVVETKTMVPWTKPEDLTFDVNGKLPELLPIYEGGFNALVADGSVKFIKSDTDEKTLRAFFTRDGNENVRIP